MKRDRFQVCDQCHAHLACTQMQQALAILNCQERSTISQQKIVEEVKEALKSANWEFPKNSEPCHLASPRIDIQAQTQKLIQAGCLSHLKFTIDISPLVISSTETLENFSQFCINESTDYALIQENGFITGVLGQSDLVKNLSSSRKHRFQHKEVKNFMSRRFEWITMDDFKNEDFPILQIAISTNYIPIFTNSSHQESSLVGVLLVKNKN